jgi:hypothetical protein
LLGQLVDQLVELLLRGHLPMVPAVGSLPTLDSQLYGIAHQAACASLRSRRSQTVTPPILV